MNARQNTVQTHGPLDPRILNRWLLVQAILWPPLLVAEAVGAGPSEITLGAVLVSFASLWFLLGCGRFAADWATLFRFCALLGLIGTLPGLDGLNWIWWTVALLAICSDLLDGFLARRFGGSDAGAVLDMETDQLGTMILSLALMKLTPVGPWVLLLPGLKYAFALGILASGRIAHEPKPKEGNNNRGRLVHLLVMVALLTGLAPATPDVIRLPFAITAVVALCWSFGDDAVWILFGSQRKKRESAA